MRPTNLEFVPMIKAHLASLDRENTKDLPERHVSLSNQVARASQSLLLTEKRIVALALAHVDSLPTKPLFDAQKNQGWKVRISAMDYADVFEVDSSTAYTQLHDAAKRLWQRYIRYTLPSRKGVKDVSVRWVSSATYAEGEGWVELNFTPEIAPHILGLRSKFTTYKLKHAAGLDSLYAWRLYECLKSWQNTGLYAPDIDEFHQAMESPESCRKNFKDLRVRVIDPAVKSINQKTDITVQWEPVRAGGRKVTGLRFTFEPTMQAKLDLE